MDPEDTSADATTSEQRSLRLAVSGIRLFGRHGVEPGERERGNRFEIDLECEVPAPASDDLPETIDYREMVELVHRISDRQAFTLIETVADAISDELLAHFPTLQSVVVRVSKLDPPGLAGAARTTAEVARTRA